MSEFTCGVCGHNECVLKTKDDSVNPFMCPWDLRSDFAHWLPPKTENIELLTKMEKHIYNLRQTLKVIQLSLESDAVTRSEGTWRYSINNIDKVLKETV